MLKKLILNILKLLVILPLYLRKIQRKPITRVLVMQLNFIGDVIVITPVLRLLKFNFPEAEIDIWVNQISAQVVKDNPYITNVFVDETPQTKKNSLKQIVQKFWGNRHVLKLMMNRRYDVVIDFSEYLDSAIVSLLLGAPLRIGTARTPALKSAYTSYTYKTFKQKKHLNSYYLDALEPLGIIKYTRDDLRLDLFLQVDDLTCADQLLAVANESPTVVISPFAGWINKEWPLERFALLAKLLVDSGIYVYFVGTKNDRTRFRDFEEIFEYNNVVDLFGKTTLMESAALISKCSLFIGQDSSMGHVASAFRTPTILLYGGTNVDMLEYFDDEERVALFTRQDCSAPFGQLFCGDDTMGYQCPHNFKCLSDITVESVLNTCSMLIGKRYR